MNRLIIFLIRKKLGLRKYELFSFKNQKNNFDRYYFNDERLMKRIKIGRVMCEDIESHIRFNFLLSDEALELIERETND